MSADQWRPIVEKYFKPEDVEKALYVIDHESGGRPDAVGDNGASHGLFQLNDHGLGSGMSVADRLDPEKNIATAATAVYGGSGWKPWGEGATFHGATFGSLGNNPYPGSSVSNGRALTGAGVTFNGGATTPNSTTTPPAKPATNAQAALQAATAALGEFLNNMPSVNDPAYATWAERVTALQKYVDNLTTQAGLRDTTFANTNSQFNDKLALDTAAQNNAQNSITDFLNGAAESRGRATLNLDAQKLLQTWGTPEGKSSYTPDELGSSFANTYKQAGLDPTRASLNYTGTARVNPGADLAAGDAQFGAGGTLPTLPKLNTSAADIPGLPQSPDWPEPTTTYKLPALDAPGWHPGTTTTAPLPGTPAASAQQIRDAAGHLFSPAF